MLEDKGAAEGRDVEVDDRSAADALAPGSELVPEEAPPAEVEKAEEQVEYFEGRRVQAPWRRWRLFVSALKKFLFVILQAVLMVLVLAGSYFIAKRMIDGRPEPKKRPAFATVYTVDIATAEQKDNQPSFISYGQTVAARTVELRTLVSGEITRVSPNLRNGASVKKGEALVVIDDFSFKGALTEAEANLAEARARLIENQASVDLERGKLAAAREQLEIAERDVTRAEKLLASRSITNQQVESRRVVASQRRQALALIEDTINLQNSRKAQIDASIGRLQWGVDRAKRNLESTTLLAPFDGIVRTSSAEAGRNVTANDVVVSLYEQGALEVEFTLSDVQYGRLQTSKQGLIGRKVNVVWTVGGKRNSYQATIDRLTAEITSSRGGVGVRALVADTTAASGVALRPGAFVEVEVPDVVFEKSFKLPDTVLYGSNTVYVVIDGKLEEREVEVSSFDQDEVIISSGITDGERVLNTRITEVSAGLAVRTEAEAAIVNRLKATNSGSAEKKKDATNPKGGKPSERKPENSGN